MGRSRRSIHGVTYLEVITAIGILAIVTAAGARIAGECQNIWRDQRDMMDANRDLVTASRAVSHDLIGAMRGAAGFQGVTGKMVLEDIMSFPVALSAGEKKTEVDADSVRFATTEARDAQANPAGVIVEYAVAKDKDGKLRGLERRAAPLGEPARAVSSLVAPRVAELKLEYLARAGGEEKWVGAWSASQGLPAAVRVTLGVWVGGVKGVHVQRLSTVVAIREGTRVTL